MSCTKLTFSLSQTAVLQDAQRENGANGANAAVPPAADKIPEEPAKQ